MWPKLRVLARSSPTDKHTLVKGNELAHAGPPLPLPRLGCHAPGWLWSAPRLPTPGSRACLGSGVPGYGRAESQSPCQGSGGNDG